MKWTDAVAYCASRLGRPLENTEACAKFAAWFEARHQKIEHGGGDQKPPGAAAVVDLAQRMEAWVRLRVPAGSSITMAHLDQMEIDVRRTSEAEGDGPSWLCEP